MTVLLAGATGATGRLLAAQLLERGHTVHAIVRDPKRLPEPLRSHKNLQLLTGNLLEFPEEALDSYVNNIDAMASCLGHNLSLRGILGPPHRLVTRSVQRMCEAVIRRKPAHPVKMVLMNTVGNSNRDLAENVSTTQKLILAGMRLVLPPLVDNEKAAEYLRTEIGQSHPFIEWAAVRPDSLIDEETVSDYDIHPSPTRSALFDPGKTSRINVAHFMATLIDTKTAWNTWKGQMPVIYNR